MEYSISILIRHAPYGRIDAAEAIRHAGGAISEGIRTHVLLVDDGVYVARVGHDPDGTAWTSLIPPLSKALANGTRVYVHAPSAQVRGLPQNGDLIAGVEFIQDDALAEILATSGAIMVY